MLINLIGSRWVLCVIGAGALFAVVAGCSDRSSARATSTDTPNGIGSDSASSTHSLEGTDSSTDSESDSECGSSDLNVSGTFHNDVADLEFDHAKVTMAHSADAVDPRLACLAQIDIELTVADGCLLYVVATGKLTEQGGLTITAATFEADAACPGFSAAAQGAYDIVEHLEEGQVVLEHKSFPKEDGVSHCFASSLEVRLRGDLEGTGGARLRVDDTSILIAGDFVSKQSDGLCCPCQMVCGDHTCGDDGCGGNCGYCGVSPNYCDDQGYCHNDCDGRECGPSPTFGEGCGSCSGEDEICDVFGQCVPDPGPDTETLDTDAHASCNEDEWRMVATGQDHTCAIRDLDGVLLCWGDNTYGQLGNGAFYPKLVPTPVSGGDVWTAVVAGFQHTCGLRADGKAYCWGHNLHGQLGDDTFTHNPSPTPVYRDYTYSALAAGAWHTCGIRASDEKAFCWGADSFGQLGDGDTVNLSTPQAVLGDHTFGTLAGGELHTCGLRATDGKAYCWGLNSLGQLGDNTTDYSYTPTPVYGDDTYSAIATGNDHTCGVRASDDQAYCWGSNVHGQLGDATNIFKSAPTPVDGNLTVAALAAGTSFTCGVRATDSALTCFGKNDHSQLGDDSTDPSNVPTAAVGALTWAAVETGVTHACGITATDNRLYCWGNNEQGQLGNGTTSATPTRAPACVH